MKQFLLKIVLFFLLLLAPLAAISYINQKKILMEIEKQRILPKDASVLVLGDSHTECSLDPNYYEGMVNRSFSSERFFYNYAKTRYYIEANPQIKVVILSFSPYRIGKYNEDRVFGSKITESYPIYFPLLGTQPDLLIDICRRDFNREFLKNYLVYNLGVPSKELFNRFFMRKEIVFFQGGFLNKYINVISKLNVNNSYERHYGTFDEKSPESYIGDFELENLHLLSQYLDNKGVELVFYSAPCHSLYNERIPRFLIHYTDSLENEFNRRYGVHSINQLNYSLSDSCFRDFDHINTRGAAIVTPIVRDSINHLVERWVDN